MEDKSPSNMNRNIFQSSNYNGPRKRGSGFSIAQIIESDFSKRRRLKRDRHKWALPRPEALFKSNIWQIKYMMKSKEELNSVKNQLSDYIMKDWHKHTKKSNHAGDVVSIVRKKIFPELLTQAWCKFYEIVSNYCLVPAGAVKSNTLNSLHLCEAPGAFITSLNHYLKLNYPNIKWEWRASTLNPYYEGNKLSFMINDDRFILHTLDSWEFGTDQSGDMFKLDNINGLIAMAKLLSPIHLVTADGSIDCQSDPGEQEAIVSPLHYCETFIALSVLSKGGSFLLKIFTMFECQTISLLYLLSCVFETVDFFKPATSKEGNSEVYVICLNFAGPYAVEPYLDVLFENIHKSNEKALFFEHQIPMDFLCDISECSDFFKSVQLAVLERNIETFASNQTDEDNYKLFQIKRRLAYSYLERYSLEPLPLPEDCVVGNDIIRQTPTLNLDSRNEEWTFADKKCEEAGGVVNALQSLRNQLMPYVFGWPCDSDSDGIIWFKYENFHLSPDLKVTVVFGDPVMTVYSSKFCLGFVLHIWNKLCQIKQFSLPSALYSSDTVEGLLERLALMSETFKTCDMRQIPYEGNTYKFETDCLVRLADILKIIKNGENLILVGVPLLTRVSVGIVYSLSYAFDKVGFLNPAFSRGYCVLFINKRDETFLKEMFEDLLRRINDEKSLALHSFVPITQLVKDINWYKCVLESNQIHIRNAASKNIDALLSEFVEVGETVT